MNSTANSTYYPSNGDVITLENGNGGFVGGFRDKGSRLNIVEKAHDWQQFVFEGSPDKFALRQKVSGNYIGGVQNKNELFMLWPEKQEKEIFSYKSIPGGMVNIINHKGLNLGAAQDKRLAVTAETPIKESWKFALIERTGQQSSMLSTGVSLPQPGTEISIIHSNGGYIGGHKVSGQKIEVVDQKKDWQLFTLEPKDGAFAIKQKISNLYIGDTSEPNERVGLVEKPQQNELFYIEPKENGLFAIRNHRGLYMSRQDSHVIWTNNCSSQEHWKIHTDEPNLAKLTWVEPVDGQYYGVLHVNSGGFIGSDVKEGVQVRLVHKMQNSQEFQYQDHGGIFGLKQKVSGLYVGIADNLTDNLRLTGKFLMNQKLALVNKGNGVFAIKNHNGLFLTKKGDFLGWTNNCGSDELWKFVQAGLNIGK